MEAVKSRFLKRAKSRIGIGARSSTTINSARETTNRPSMPIRVRS
jgi:hypothetical protein